MITRSQLTLQLTNALMKHYREYKPTFVETGKIIEKILKAHNVGRIELIGKEHKTIGTQ